MQYKIPERKKRYANTQLSGIFEYNHKNCIEELRELGYFKNPCFGLESRGIHWRNYLPA